MFSSIRIEIADRILATKQWYAASSSTQPPASVITKGLTFVQNYAVYEYTVIHSVTAALHHIKGQGLSLQDVRPELLSFILNSDIDSMLSTGLNQKWTRRIELFRRVLAAEPISTISFETVFPTDGSHFRVAQIRTIWSLFGITASLVPNPRLLGRIDEMVEHRNAIAHGRESAAQIGGRFSDNDIQARIDDVQELCMHIVDTLDLHCQHAQNLTR